MFFLLNITMLAAVLVMRFYIKRTPNLIPNENLVIVHVVLFTMVTCVWIVESGLKYYTFVVDVTTVGNLYFFDNNLVCAFYWANIAKVALLNLLNLFMLYMLH